MDVFLSYAVGQSDAAIAARLRAVAAAYDIRILLPDRTRWNGNEIGVDNKMKITDSNAVIALLTNTAPVPAISEVNRELQFAMQLIKPIIALIEQGVHLQNVPEDRLVYFNRYNPTSHESTLMNVLSEIRDHQQKSANDLAALGWIAGIALGLVSLGALYGNEK